jgi:hypothetical protein
MPLEYLPPAGEASSLAPRGTLVAGAGTLPGLRSEIWMGGAHSATGDHLDGAWMASAWVIDCAGDTHPGSLATAERRESCVFADMEHRPDKIDRLIGLAGEFAIAAREADGPERMVALCQYGMNRSGLATGLLLRALGASYPETIGLIRRARPGALANLAFEKILAEERYPGGR